MPIPATVEHALKSSQAYDELRAIAVALFAEGNTEQAVYELFEAVRADLRLAGREVDEEVVMDVMDCLVGWCSPHQELTPASTTDRGNGVVSARDSAMAAPTTEDTARW